MNGAAHTQDFPGSMASNIPLIEFTGVSVEKKLETGRVRAGQSCEKKDGGRGHPIVSQRATGTRVHHD